MSKFRKTRRYNLIVSSNTIGLLDQTAALYRNAVAYYLQVFQDRRDILGTGDWLRRAEILTHRTSSNLNPAYDFDARFPFLPSGFRRSAIAEAYGLALAWQSNYRKWQTRKAKAGEKSVRRLAVGKSEINFMERPPVYPDKTVSWPVYYKTEFRILDERHMLLKVFTGNAFAYRKVVLMSPLFVPTGYTAESPMLVRKKHGFELHVPMVQESRCDLQKATVLAQDPSLKICAVDQGINNHAVCTIQNAKGRVLASLFFSGAEDNHLRKLLLEKVARLQRETRIIPEGETFAADLWRKIRNMDDDIAHQVSRRIVNFAKAHGAKVIVFEHLGSFSPAKGTRSRRQNLKFLYWLRGRIFRFAQYKALHEGVVVVRVNPKNTSRQCPYCGCLEITRYTFGRENSTKLARCGSCEIDGINADWLATLNIGQKFQKKHKRPA